MLPGMDKVRAWLVAMSKTPADLAKDIGAAESSVRNWLAGRNTPGGLMLRRLHERTSIPLEDLVPRDVA